MSVQVSIVYYYSGEYYVHVRVQEKIMVGARHVHVHVLNGILFIPFLIPLNVHVYSCAHRDIYPSSSSPWRNSTRAVG